MMMWMLWLLLLYPLIGLALCAIALAGAGRDEHRRIEEEEARRRLGEDPPGAIIYPLKGVLVAMTIWPIMLVRSFRAHRT
jgi:hypothetical protein